jgi:hypothetical protein
MKKLEFFLFFFLKLNYLKNTINQEEIGISKEKKKEREKKNNPKKRA